MRHCKILGIIWLFISAFVYADHWAPDRIYKKLTAIRVTKALKIDGHLKEAEWFMAEPATGFVQTEPDPGEPMTYNTEVYVLYDDNYIYFGFYCHDPDPENIYASLATRDSRATSDWVSVYIDAYNDKRTGCRFSLNPVGVQRDGHIFDDNETDFDWNAVWIGDAQIVSDGWTAEIAIPFSILRFNPSDEIVWGLNFNRYIQRLHEDGHWVEVFESEHHPRMSKAGQLLGLKDINTRRKIEMLPFGVARAKSGFGEYDGIEGDGGLDVKYGITPDLTLDLSINPDFAQVEVDEDILNLTNLETYFPEKRPFFLEGNSIFNNPVGLFYSRRIGKPLDSQYNPLTNINLGAKLTGRMASGTSIGVIGVWTPQEKDEDNSILEDESLYSVARVKQDLYANSYIGVMNVNKDWGGGHSRVISTDMKFWFNGDYFLTGQISKSFNSDEGEENYLGFVKFSKENDKHFNFDIEYQYIGNDFNIDQFGFLRESGFQQFNAEISLRNRFENKAVREMRISLEAGKGIYLTGENREQYFGMDAHIKTANFWRIMAGLRFFGDFFDPYEGDYGQKYDGGMRIWGRLHSDWSKPIWFMGGFGYADFRNGTQTSLSASIRSRPADNIEMSLRYNFNATDDGYRLHWEDGPEEYYPVLRDTEYHKLLFKGTYTFTRNLDLRFFLQYVDYERLNEKSFGVPLEDISSIYNSLLLNLVLKWEFNPGSFFYFVFTEFHGTDEDGSWLDPEYGIQAKLSYWFRI